MTLNNYFINYIVNISVKEYEGQSSFSYRGSDGKY